MANPFEKLKEKITSILSKVPAPPAVATLYPTGDVQDTTYFIVTESNQVDYQAIKLPEQPAAQALYQPALRIKLDDFTKQRNLGAGNFGIVDLYRYDLYAEPQGDPAIQALCDAEGLIAIKQSSDNEQAKQAVLAEQAITDYCYHAVNTAYNKARAATCLQDGYEVPVILSQYSGFVKKLDAAAKNTADAIVSAKSRYKSYDLKKFITKLGHARQIKAGKHVVVDGKAIKVGSTIALAHSNFVQDMDIVYAQLSSAMATSIAAMHDRGFLHLDIAPRNFLMSETKVEPVMQLGVIAADFGRAEKIDPTTGRSASAFDPASKIPIRWTNLEIIRADPAAGPVYFSPRTDLFALRVSLINMLSLGLGFDESAAIYIGKRHNSMEARVNKLREQANDSQVLTEYFENLNALIDEKIQNIEKSKQLLMSTTIPTWSDYLIKLDQDVTAALNALALPVRAELEQQLASLAAVKAECFEALGKADLDSAERSAAERACSRILVRYWNFFSASLAPAATIQAAAMQSLNNRISNLQALNQREVNIEQALVFLNSYATYIKQPNWDKPATAISYSAERARDQADFLHANAHFILRSLYTRTVAPDWQKADLLNTLQRLMTLKVSEAFAQSPFYQMLQQQYQNPNTFEFKRDAFRSAVLQAWDEFNNLSADVAAVEATAPAVVELPLAITSANAPVSHVLPTAIASESSKPIVIFALGTGEKIASGKQRIIAAFANACTDEGKLLLEGPDLLGFEVAKKVDAALKYVDTQMQTRQPPPTELCFTGFSRGAVIGSRLANAVQAKYPDLKIHIYAIDPVAGSTDKKDLDAQRIPGNVKNYVATYSDDQRLIMKPQGPSRTHIAAPEQTAVTFLKFPGEHTEVTRGVRGKKPRMEAAELNWILLYQFLTRHGVQFKNSAMPPLGVKTTQGKGVEIDIEDRARSQQLQGLIDKPGELLKLYSAMRANANYARSKLPRSKNDLPEDFVLDADFFINQHERELFKLAYPCVFNYLFENNAEKFDASVVETELLDIKDHAVEIFNHILQYRAQRLEQNSIANPTGFIIKDMNDQAFLIRPAGKHQIEMLRLTNEIPVGNTPLTLLERKIIDALTLYKRSRNEFARKQHHDIANKTREKVREIMNSPAQDEAEKIVKLLNLLNIITLQLPDNSRLKQGITAVTRSYVVPTAPSLSNYENFFVSLKDVLKPRYFYEIFFEKLLNQNKVLDSHTLTAGLLAIKDKLMAVETLATLQNYQQELTTVQAMTVATRNQSALAAIIATQAPDFLRLKKSFKQYHQRLSSKVEQLEKLTTKLNIISPVDSIKLEQLADQIKQLEQLLLPATIHQAYLDCLGLVLHSEKSMQARLNTLQVKINTIQSALTSTRATATQWQHDIDTAEQMHAKSASQNSLDAVRTVTITAAAEHPALASSQQAMPAGQIESTQHFNNKIKFWQQLAADWGWQATVHKANNHVSITAPKQLGNLGFNVDVERNVMSYSRPSAQALKQMPANAETAVLDKMIEALLKMHCTHVELQGDKALCEQMRIKLNQAAPALNIVFKAGLGQTLPENSMVSNELHPVIKH